MKYHKTWDEILGQGSKVKILRVLASEPVELTGREIARLAKQSQRNIHASLYSLFKAGIVLMRRSGKSKLYQLNSDSVLVKQALLPLFRLEKNLLGEIADKIGKRVKNILSIILFGSVAEGKEKWDSDLEILIVMSLRASLPESEKVLDQLNFEISKGFGNGLSPVLLKVNDFKRRYKAKDELIRKIADHGRLLYGKTPLELIYD